jgi:hypothetical protein
MSTEGNIFLMHYRYISILYLTFLLDFVIQAAVTLTPWGDFTFQDDSTYNQVLDYINELPDDYSILESEDSENLDPTIVPVSSELQMHSEYISNILIMQVEIAQQSRFTTITAANNQTAVKVAHIQFTDLLPEFPNTSDEGFAYVVNISAWSDEQKKAIEQKVSKCILNALTMYH